MPKNSSNSRKFWTAYAIALFVTVFLNYFHKHLFFASIADVIWMILCCIMLMIYYHRNPANNNGTQSMLLVSAGLLLMMLIFRGSKFYFLAELDTACRYLWYMYYIPFLLVPLSTLYASLYIGRSDSDKLNKNWIIPAVITIFLLLGILTNDLHQQAFGLCSDFCDWSTDYSHKWLYYAAVIWAAILVTVSLVILLKKNRHSSLGVKRLIPFIPLLLGSIYLILLSSESIYYFLNRHPLEFTEASCFMIIAFWQCCIDTGLINTNKNYINLITRSSISAIITDEKNNVIYASNNAKFSLGDTFSPETLHLDPKEHRLRSQKIRAGYGYWIENISDLSRLNEELEETHSRLSEQAELIRLENEVRENQLHVSEQIRLYNTISDKVKTQSEKISALSAEAEKNVSLYDRNILLICFYNAYIKRMANLMLIAEHSGSVHAAELGLSIAESLRYLNKIGIPAYFSGDCRAILSGDNIISTYEAFETLVETYLDSLTGVSVNLTQTDDPVLKITFEGVEITIPENIKNTLMSVSVETQLEIEDNVSYLRFISLEGGMAI